MDKIAVLVDGHISVFSPLLIWKEWRSNYSDIGRPSQSREPFSVPPEDTYRQYRLTDELIAIGVKGKEVPLHVHLTSAAGR